MLNRIATSALALFSFAACASDELICNKLGDKTYRNAVIYQLTQENIKFQVSKDGKICMSSSIWTGGKFSEILINMQEYYGGVAHIIRNEERLKKVKKWVNDENISHKMSSNNNGTFIVIYSSSPEEAENNRKKLDLVMYGE